MKINCTTKVKCCLRCFLALTYGPHVPNHVIYVPICKVSICYMINVKSAFYCCLRLKSRQLLEVYFWLKQAGTWIVTACLWSNSWASQKGSSTFEPCSTWKIQSGKYQKPAINYPLSFSFLLFASWKELGKVIS